MKRATEKQVGFLEALIAETDFRMLTPQGAYQIIEAFLEDRERRRYEIPATERQQRKLRTMGAQVESGRLTQRDARFLINSFQDPDSPATEGQRKYLKSLGMPYDEATITKSQAAELITNAVLDRRAATAGGEEVEK